MGQKLAAYNASGVITAFYDTIDSPAPDGITTIEITDSQWQSCINSYPPYTVQSGVLTAPTAAQLLAQARIIQISTLSGACATSIAGGFSSSALGSSYTYPSTPNDQANQMAIAGCATGGNLWCTTSGGTWALAAHTQAQAQAVIASFASWLNQCQTQLVTLNSQVAAATTMGAVQAVAWVNPL